MSGKVPRTYSRKRAQPAPAINEFDALVQDNSNVASNQPAATKTGRHVGKWGVSTYTSLRTVGPTSSPDETSPSGSPSHVVGNINGEHGGMHSLSSSSNTSSSKPLNTYKRRKFFKSRTTDDTETGSVNKAVESSTRVNDCSSNNSDFDSMMSRSNKSRSSSRASTPGSAQYPLLETDSIDDCTLPVKNKPNKTGIKLKIFKNTNSQLSSITEDNFSNVLESTSNSSSSGGSSPANSMGAENRDIDTTQSYVNKSPSYNKNRASINNNILIISDTLESNIERSSTLTSMVSSDPTLDLHLSPSTNTTLDSSMDDIDMYGEIRDQRTGLPLSMITNTSLSPGFFSKPIIKQEVEPKRTYSKNVSKSNELNKYLNKNSEALQAVKEKSVKTRSALLASSSEISTQEVDELCSLPMNKKTVRSYGRKTAKKVIPISSIENGSCSISQPSINAGSNIALLDTHEKVSVNIDLRPDECQIELPKLLESTSFVPTKSVEIATFLPTKAAEIASLIPTKAAEIASFVPTKTVESTSFIPKKSELDDFNLFSSGFNEDEVEDRTLLNWGDSPGFDSATDTNLMFNEDIAVTMATHVAKNIAVAHDSASEKFNSYLPRTQSLPVSAGDFTKESSSGIINNSQAPRKRSIFKSRSVKSEVNKKRATYNHKWHTDEDKVKEESSADGENANGSNLGAISSSASAYAFDDFEEEYTEAKQSLNRVQSWSDSGASSSVLPDEIEAPSGSMVTKVTCNRKDKQYYTVIKNVKKLYQLQEQGEFQEFNDDVEYFMDALRNTNSISTRCLAALNLAQKCMVPSFRMHLRAHATVCKFFGALVDAPSNPNLSLCSAMVMFALSQDRLNMDLDRDSLELMLNLLDADDTQEGTAGSSEAISKSRELCRQLQAAGHAKHLSLHDIHTGTLAMETLLSLTSKRAGEWFKEELRTLGGADHLMRTVSTCCGTLERMASLTAVTSRASLDTFTKAERCLKVLENVTMQNETNQEYLLTYQSGEFVKTLMKLYELCHNLVPPAHDAYQRSSGAAVATSKEVSGLQCVANTLLITMKVLVDITHHPTKLAMGSKLIGAMPATYDVTLRCLMQLPSMLLGPDQFQLRVLSCSLLINLMEHSKDNRDTLMGASAPSQAGTDDPVEQSAISALLELFYSSEASARKHEEHTDHIIDHDLIEGQEKAKADDGELEVTMEKLLAKAGNHMEDSLIAALTALLTGYCIMGNKEVEAQIRAMLPEPNFRKMVTVLKKFLRFMDLTATTTLLRRLKPTHRLVAFMEGLDPTEGGVMSVREREMMDQSIEEDAEDSFGF